MRIIAGTAKGRKLASFRGLSIRPTTDKVREAIFNILTQSFPFKNVLDLFAGTGAMGVEALSRGAEKATLVDSDPRAIRVIKKNLELCRFTEQAVIMNMDVESALHILSKKEKRFDLILIDPPYEASMTGSALKSIDEQGLLSPDGIIVSESSKRMIWDGALKGIKLTDRRSYGDTVVSFYRIMEQADPARLP